MRTGSTEAVTSALSIRHGADILHAGGVIAYPTEGVYGLGCLPHLDEAVDYLLAIKGRSSRAGLILIAANYDLLTRWIAPTAAEKEQLTSHRSNPICHQ